MRKSILVFAGLLLAVTGCEYQFPEEEPPPGDQLSVEEFKRFAVLGGPYSAGVKDGALYTEGSEHAYVSLFGEKLNKLFGEQVFRNIPIDTDLGYNIEESIEDEALRGKYQLAFRDFNSEHPARSAGEGDPVGDWSGSLNNLNNFSIPGMKIYQLDDADELGGNPYFDRIADEAPGSSLLDMAISLDPGIVLLQPGTGDLTSYAVGGAVGDPNPDSDAIQEKDLASAALFEQSLNEAVTRILTETGADIIIANVINPLPFFYFDTLPWYFTPEQVRARTADISIYDQYNEDVQQYNSEVRQEGKPELMRSAIVFDPLGARNRRAKVIIDEDMPEAVLNDGTVLPNYRHMRAGELFLYNGEEEQYKSLQDSIAFGTSIPLHDRFVLTETEQDNILQRIEAFNTSIAEIASGSDRVHLLDFHSLFNRVKAGTVSFNGVFYTLDLSRNSILSADGYTMNFRGQALMANELIELVNREYQADLKKIDINAFEGISFVNDF